MTQTTIAAPQERRREVWLDWLRVIACMMVMMTHATEPFHLGGEGSLGIGEQGALGLWTTPVQILATVIISYTVVAIGCVLIRKIPKLGTMIVG